MKKVHLEQRFFLMIPQQTFLYMLYRIEINQNMSAYKDVMRKIQNMGLVRLVLQLFFHHQQTPFRILIQT